MDRDKRERKATKDDDADVPIYYWTQLYLEGSTLDWKALAQQSSIRQEEQCQRVELALEGRRHKLFIRVWKKAIVVVFFQLVQQFPKKSKQDMKVTRPE